MESTTTQTTPVITIPSISSIQNPNAIDSNFVYPKRKSPSVLVHYNAEPIDSRDAQKVYSSSTVTPPPITTYKPVFSTTTPTLPPL